MLMNTINLHPPFQIQSKKPTVAVANNIITANDAFSPKSSGNPVGVNRFLQVTAFVQLVLHKLSPIIILTCTIFLIFLKTLNLDISALDIKDSNDSAVPLLVDSVANGLMDLEELASSASDDDSEDNIDSEVENDNLTSSQSYTDPNIHIEVSHLSSIVAIKIFQAL